MRHLKMRSSEGRWRLPVLLTASIVLFACASTTPPAEELPAVTEDGLVRVPSDTVDAAYRRDGASLAPYTAVHIEECKVSFRKNWIRDQNLNKLGTDETVRQSDVDRIASELSAAFQQEFTKALEARGYRVVSEGGAQGVLTVRPEIVDLDVTAPNLRSSTTGITHTYAASAGEMTLKMDLVDGASGSRIGYVVDRERDKEDGALQFSNRVTNRAKAQRVLRKWAGLLATALDEAKAG